MRKFIGILLAIAFVFAVFATPSMANGCCKGGEVGLQIEGGAGVGAMGYLGTAVTNAKTNHCFGGSNTTTKQVFIGAGVSSAANGQVCLTTCGNPNGSVNGVGNFKSSISGSILGANYSTSSTVVVVGTGH